MATRNTLPPSPADVFTTEAGPNGQVLIDKVAKAIIRVLEEEGWAEPGSIHRTGDGFWLTFVSIHVSTVLGGLWRERLISRPKR